jgi:hypothetical protein
MKQEFYVANRDFRRDSAETMVSITAEHLAVPPIKALKNIYQS